MKKILLSLVVAAAALFATSCANELEEGIKGNANGVTFEISTPELASRADFGTGAEATKLLYAVYDETARENDPNTTNYIVSALSRLDVDNALDIAGGSTSFALDLLDGNRYSVLFWAVSEDYDDAFEIQWAKKAMQMKTAIAGNNELFDAFFGYIEPFTVEGAITKSSILTRPFAQLNIGTNDFLKAEAANFDTDAISSQVVIEGVPTVLDCTNGTVGTTATITYGSTPMAAGYTFPVSGYDYLAMNYVLVGEKQVYNATLTVTDGTKTIENTYNNIPLARNYKTNVYGELLVNGSTFNVEIDETWKTPNDDNNIVETGYQFVLALLRGENVILANDITVTAADIQAALNTPAPVMSRAAASGAINVVINLGGYTITFEDGAALDLNDGSVTIEGEGAIVAGEDDGFIGDVFTAEDSEVDTEGYEGTVFTAAGLVEAFKTGSEYTVGTDIALTEPLKLAAGKEFTLKFKNNAVLSIVDTATTSFALITNQGKLTIEGEGKLTIKATNNRGWNAYSSVLSNTVGGELTVKGVTIEHLGGTDMAYGIDNLTNGKGTSAKTTINGATVKSPYRAVRMFLNGIEAANELYVKAGVIEGGNKSIWMQDPSAKANTGKLVVEAAAELKGDVYLFVTAGSTEWPVEVSIAKAALGESEVLTGNVPAGYQLVESETEYYVAKEVAKIGETAYLSLQEAINAAEDGAEIVLISDITYDESNRTHNSGTYYDGLYYIGDKSFNLNLNGKTITNDSSVNDYLLNFKNEGEKANTITIYNGTINAASSAYCAICTSTTSTQKITINLENVAVVGNNSNGAVLKIRGGAELNVKAGTTITGEDNYVGIECAGTTTTTNIYEGAEIYMNGTTSYVGSLVGVSGKSTVNVYGGYGKSKKGGFIAMTSGGTINVSGGEWIANNDGTYANGNNSVLIAQSEKGAKSIIKVTGGKFDGGYNCYGNAVGDAQINISGGDFNSNPSTYVVEGKAAVEGENGRWTIIDAVCDEAALLAAFAEGGNIVLGKDITITEPATVVDGKVVVLDLNGKTLNAELCSALVATNGGELTVKNGKVVAYESTVRAVGGKVIVESGEYTSTGTAVDSPATLRYSLDCREGGELIVNGGTFKSNNGMINVGSTVTINGGKFENIVEKTMTRHFAYVSALLTINDGEFYGKANSSGGGCFFCGAGASGDVQVKGGKFTSLMTSGSVNRIFEVYFGGTINVTGGLFNTNGGIVNFVTENTDAATKAAYPYVAK